ncbi:ASCH domain-containing protein [Trebonia sp.]|uniref:ASCH domain-containing protein n=1 Tax=Trebonia sp. TaxID=2767075 RepID=UPI0026104E8B|nr:ASCH domain-containing protein [Trebonia sp.]
MKALTVRQPWASLIMCGAKDVECRTWMTAYRGPLLIHAGLALDQGALTAHAHLVPGDLPRGVLLGTVTMTACVRDHPSPWAEPGGWHWVLADPVPFTVPVEYRGKLGLWDVPGRSITALATRGPGRT